MGKQSLIRADNEIWFRFPVVLNALRRVPRSRFCDSHVDLFAKGPSVNKEPKRQAHCPGGFPYVRINIPPFLPNTMSSSIQAIVDYIEEVIPLHSPRE